MMIKDVQVAHLSILIPWKERHYKHSFSTPSAWATNNSSWSILRTCKNVTNVKLCSVSFPSSNVTWEIFVSSMRPSSDHYNTWNKSLLSYSPSTSIMAYIVDKLSIVKSDVEGIDFNLAIAIVISSLPRQHDVNWSWQRTKHHSTPRIHNELSLLYFPCCSPACRLLYAPLRPLLPNSIIKRRTAPQ